MHPVIKLTAHFYDDDGRIFTIEPTVLKDIATHESHTEYYLHIQQKDGSYTHDYMQETLEKTKAFALRKFGVPLGSWVETAFKEI